MILPGISGSFILVLLGMYATVLSAIKSLDLVFLAVFAFGAAAGLPLFFCALPLLPLDAGEPKVPFSFYMKVRKPAAGEV